MLDIFKSETCSESLRILNEYTNLNNFVFLVDNNRITKVFKIDSYLEWETTVYFYLDDYNLTLPYTFTHDDRIMYNISGYMTLLQFIQEKKSNVRYLLNELFNFVNKFKNINFIHGNLNVHNIFICYNKNKYIIKIIDLANSYIDIHFKPLHIRSSFLGEGETKYFDNDLTHWDTFTLFCSLKKYLGVNDLVYLENFVFTFIPKNVFLLLLKRYYRTNDTLDNLLEMYTL